MSEPDRSPEHDVLPEVARHALADRHARDLSLFVTFLQHARDARQGGRLETATIWLQAASYLFPVRDDAMQELARTLAGQQRHDEAVTLVHLHAELEPENPGASFLLGYTLQMANRHAQAEAPYRAALAVQPDMPSLRNNLAIALRLSGGDSADTLSLLEAAVAANPEELHAWINLVVERRDHGDLSGALQAADRALALAPDSVLALNNASLILKEAQRWGEAEHCATRAWELAPQDPACRFNLAIIQLVRGNDAGWAGHEARWQGCPELSNRLPTLPGPRWQGESLAGKTLLVWGEQGMGDLLQFCRFLPILAGHVHHEGGRIVWNTFPQMGGLLARSLEHHVDAYSAGGGVDALPSFDYELPMTSIPWMLRTTDVSAGVSHPYLHADPHAVQCWQARFAKEAPGALKVGLVWTGSATHQRNRFRRVGIARYQAAFAGMEGVQFYSLQPGAGDDIAAAQAAGFPITDPTQSCRSFDDTAALVSALDLVITVCTSVAHLSGALGRRTWVLLDVNPHWPWQLDRSDSPWYPSATLYRQPTFMDWDTVMAAVSRDLSALSRKVKRGRAHEHE